MKETFKIFIDIEKTDNGFFYKRTTTSGEVDETIIDKTSLSIPDNYTYEIGDDLRRACERLVELYTGDKEEKEESTQQEETN